MYYNHKYKNQFNQFNLTVRFNTYEDYKKILGITSKTKNIWYLYRSYVFFTGDTYQFQGDRYVVVDVKPEQAKQYTSKARAMNAANNYDFENYSFIVKPLE